MKNNSVIFKNPQDEHLIDLSCLGTMLVEDTTILITQENHFFMPGDVLTYDLQNQKFIKALAINTMQCEVCGVVSEYIDINNFILVTKGNVQTSQYKYPDGSTLWLSEVIPGKLTSIEPTSIFKEVGTQVSEGIINVDIRMGIATGIPQPGQGESTFYTKEELDEIIANVL